jgi:uncharacterized protein (TIGR00369 family)
MQADELQKMLDGTPVHRALRLRLAETVEGADAAEAGIVLRAEPGAEHAGADGLGFLHGGVVATILDTTATFALIHATGTDWNTVDLRVDFVRPAPSGPLEARGSAVQIGRRLGRAKADLYAAGSDRLLASATGTFVRAEPDAVTTEAVAPDAGTSA